MKACSKSLFVSGVGKRNALLRIIAPEFAAYGMRLVGADAAIAPPARCEVGYFVRMPYAQELGFRVALLDAIRKFGVGGVVTLIDPEIPLLGEIEADAALLGARIGHPVVGTSRLCEDKYEFWRLLKHERIGCIETSLGALDCFPQICKDRKGSAASGFSVINSADELRRISAEAGKGRDGLIYQPFCDGVHYCVDAYFSIKTGGLVDFCAKRVVSKHNGESYLLESTDAARFVDILKKVSSVLPMRGIVNFDVYDEVGALKVMEVNCRIGGNYPASHAFGCNLVKHLAAELVDADHVATYAPTSYPPGLCVAKYFEFTAPFAKPNWLPE